MNQIAKNIIERHKTAEIKAKQDAIDNLVDNLKGKAKRDYIAYLKRLSKK